MPRLYNLHHDYVVINHGEPGVPPGGPYDFTDEQVAAGLAGSWSETDPREGLADEQVFKLARDHSRAELDLQALHLGIDPSDLGTKQAVAEAIQTALDAKAQSIEDVPDTDPAESGDKE